MYRYIWTIELNQPVTPESEEAFVSHWRSGSEIIQEYPGARGTHIHVDRDKGQGSYFLVAEWDFKEARDAAMDDLENGDSDCALRWRQLPANDSFGRIAVFAGSEIGVVLPAPQ